MKENEKHVRNTCNGQEHLSLCGKNISGMFCFEHIDHAYWNAKNGGRLITCPKCSKEILKTFLDESI